MSSCPICLEPELIVPAACVPCGHTFCHACISQWTLSPPRFGLSLCPQCRSPVREVQKLFISDWPVSGSSSPTGLLPTQHSAWQQFMQLVNLVVYFMSIPFNYLAQYGPEMARRLTEWLNHLTERLLLFRREIIRYAEIWYRDWLDLGRSAQCLVGSALLLVALLLVQDLQDKDGIHRGIILPIVMVLVDIVKQACFASAYVLYRPMVCFLVCGQEVAMAVIDVAYVLVSSVLRVAFDMLCVPWLVACVAAGLVFSVLSMLASFVRICLFCVVIALSLGVPTYLGAPQNEGLRAQLQELAQAVLERLRQAILNFAPRVVQRGPDDPQRRENIIIEILRHLELRNNEGREQEGATREHGVRSLVEEVARHREVGDWIAEESQYERGERWREEDLGRRQNDLPLSAAQAVSLGDLEG